MAQRLEVPAVIVEDWLAGKTGIPDAKLLALLDLLDSLLDETGGG